MGVIARVKWSTYKGSQVVKLLAELNFTAIDIPAPGLISSSNEKYRYYVIVKAYEVGSASPKALELFTEHYKTLPEALSFFKDLVSATGAEPFKGDENRHLSMAIESP